MLTARDSEIDRVIGLSVGADDYLIKPFFPSELVARIKAMLRRVRGAGVAPAQAERVFGALRIDPLARRVWLDGQEIELSRIEYDVLNALSENPRITLRRDQLLDRVWGNDWFGDDHVIDAHLSNLRRKLGDDARHARATCAPSAGLASAWATARPPSSCRGAPAPGRGVHREEFRICG